MRTPCCKQLLNKQRHSDLKNRSGQTLLHYAIALEEDQLAVALLQAGASTSVLNAAGETAWQAFVHSWAAGWYGTKFYVVLKAFIARLGDAVDITCERRGDTTLHMYAQHLDAIKSISHCKLQRGFVVIRRPGVVNDSVHCLFLLLNTGCCVNARDKFQELPSALEIRTKKLRAKVAPISEKLGATLKRLGPR